MEERIRERTSDKTEKASATVLEGRGLDRRASD